MLIMLSRWVSDNSLIGISSPSFVVQTISPLSRILSQRSFSKSFKSAFIVSQTNFGVNSAHINPFKYSCQSWLSEHPCASQSSFSDKHIYFFFSGSSNLLSTFIEKHDNPGYAFCAAPGIPYLFYASLNLLRPTLNSRV